MTIKKEILKALPSHPDFLPINAHSFDIIVEKYGTKRFFNALYKLQDEDNMIEINHKAEGLRIFKLLKVV